MTIAGLAVGATQGFRLYPRRVSASDSDDARGHRTCEGRGLSRRQVQGSGRAFHLEVREAAGAYICGEETSLLESLEGKRGMVRYRPPLPAIKGLFGKPTDHQQRAIARERAR